MAFNDDDSRLKSLDEVLDDYQSFEDATVDTRKLAEKCQDYRANNQWTTQERDALAARGQPAITINRISTQIDYLLGYERQGRTVPRAYPRTRNDERDATAATEVLRYVADENDLPVTFSYMWEDLLVSGTAGCSVRTIQRPDGPSVICEVIPYDRLWYDQRSRYLDFRDAAYKGIAVWMDLREAIQTFPQATEVLEATPIGWTTTGSDAGTANPDLPADGSAFDSPLSRSRVKVYAQYYRTGGIDNPNWYYCVFTQGGFIIHPAPSPYLNIYGESICPLIYQSSRIDRNNLRFGLVAQMLDIQDEINKRRSQALSLVVMKRVIRDEGAVLDVPRMKQELAKSAADIVVRPGARFEISENLELSAAHTQLMLQAESEMDAIGANAALTGRDPRQLSGRATQARQQGGIITIQPYFDCLRSAQKEVYQAVWGQIRQYWTEEKWVRVTDDNTNVRFVGLNRTVPLYEALREQGQDVPPVEALSPEEQQYLMQPVKLNDLGAMDVDIVLDNVPDVVTFQQEQFEVLADMARSGVDIPPEAIIKASPLRDKQEVIDMIKGVQGTTPQEKRQQQQAVQQQAQQQQQIQQQALALEFAQREADIQKTKAETSYKEVEAAKTMAEISGVPVAQV